MTWFVRTWCSWFAAMTRRRWTRPWCPPSLATSPPGPPPSPSSTTARSTKNVSKRRLCWNMCVFLWFIEDYYFGGMDWGNKNDNMAHHGTEEPPVYNPNNINTKVDDSWFLKYDRINSLAYYSLHFSMETMTGWLQSRTWVGSISSSQIVWRNTRWKEGHELKHNKYLCLII